MTSDDPTQIYDNRSPRRNQPTPRFILTDPDEVGDAAEAIEVIFGLYEKLLDFLTADDRRRETNLALIRQIRQVRLQKDSWSNIEYLEEGNFYNLVTNLEKFDTPQLPINLRGFYPYLLQYYDILLNELEALVIEADERARTEAPTVVTPPTEVDSVAAMLALLEDPSSPPASNEVRHASTGTVFGKSRKQLFILGGIILAASIVALLAFFLVSRRLQNNNAAESSIEENSNYLPGVLPTGTPSTLPTWGPSPTPNLFGTPISGSAESILRFNETSVPQCADPAMQIPWAVYKNVGTYIHPDTLPRNGCYNTAPLVNVVAALYPESRYGVTGSLGDVITRDGCIVAMWRYPAGYYVEIFNTYNGKTVTCTMIRDRGPNELGNSPLADAAVVIPEGIALRLNSPGDSIAHPTYTVNLKLGGIDP